MTQTLNVLCYPPSLTHAVFHEYFSRVKGPRQRGGVDCVIALTLEPEPRQPGLPFSVGVQWNVCDTLEQALSIPISLATAIFKIQVSKLGSELKFLNIKPSLLST